MPSEAGKGLSRLRNSAILSLAIGLLSLLLAASPLAGGPESLAEDPLKLLAALAWVLALALVLLVLAIAAWVLKVLGWWSMCRSGMRRFYCVTKYAVLLGPVIGVALLIAGGVALALEALRSGAFAAEGPGGAPEWGALAYALPGLLAIAVANVIEGVSILDVGLQVGVKALAVGAAVYLSTALLLPLQLLAGTPSLAALGGGFASGLGAVWSAASALASLLLAAGFHLAKRKVIGSEAQREAAGSA